jgi:hypothetical protein
MSTTWPAPVQRLRAGPVARFPLKIPWKRLQTADLLDEPTISSTPLEGSRSGLDRPVLAGEPQSQDPHFCGSRGQEIFQVCCERRPIGCLLSQPRPFGRHVSVINGVGGMVYLSSQTNTAVYVESRVPLRRRGMVPSSPPEEWTFQGSHWRSPSHPAELARRSTLASIT